MFNLANKCNINLHHTTMAINNSRCNQKSSPLKGKQYVTCQTETMFHMGTVATGNLYDASV